MLGRTLDRDRRIQRFQRGLTLRSHSFVVTLFGDAFARQRYAICVGSLIELLRPFGFSPRSIARGCIRLVDAGWLRAVSHGRRTYYSLTDAGLLRTAQAERRIYDFRLPEWDGYWLVVIPDSKLPSAVLRGIDHDLSWQGYGRAARNVYMHPAGDISVLKEILFTWRACERTCVLQGRHHYEFDFKALAALSNVHFDLEAVDQRWRSFVSRFTPLRECFNLDDPESFYARSLLIHEYRRAFLKDPNLPAALLRDDSPSAIARTMCRELYVKLAPASEAHLQRTVVTLEGELRFTPTALLERLALRRREEVRCLRGRDKRAELAERPPARPG